VKKISVAHERSFDLDPFFLSVPVAVESCIVRVDVPAVAVDELHPGFVTATVLSADDLGLGRGCGNDKLNMISDFISIPSIASGYEGWRKISAEALPAEKASGDLNRVMRIVWRSGTRAPCRTRFSDVKPLMYFEPERMQRAVPLRARSSCRERP
jgi:hypothetical protein